jgi:hypothetical protein
MENTKQQTAVECLVEQFFSTKRELSVEELIKQAKEMEKQHIIDAYAKGYIDGIARNKITAEEYYNEKFKIKQ